MDNKKLLKMKNYSLLMSNNINEICKPLFLMLDVHGYTFQRMYKSGKRLYLSNDPNWIENFYRNNYFNASSYKKFKILPKFSLWHYWSKEDFPFQKLIYDAKENFDYGNSICIVETKKDYLDTFSIRSRPCNFNANNEFINRLDEIEKFNSYFLNVAKKIIDNAYSSSITIPEKSISENGINSLSVSNLIKYSDSPEKYFSKQESECIKKLIFGCSSKEIGRKIDISYRTVDKHIENVKNKTNISFRGDIVKFLIRFSHNKRIFLRELYEA